MQQVQATIVMAGKTVIAIGVVGGNNAMGVDT